MDDKRAFIDASDMYCSTDFAAHQEALGDGLYRHSRGCVALCSSARKVDHTVVTIRYSCGRNRPYRGQGEDIVIIED